MLGLYSRLPIAPSSCHNIISDATDLGQWGSPAILEFRISIKSEQESQTQYQWVSIYIFGGGGAANCFILSFDGFDLKHHITPQRIFHRSSQDNLGYVHGGGVGGVTGKTWAKGQYYNSMSMASTSPLYTVHCTVYSYDRAKHRLSYTIVMPAFPRCAPLSQTLPPNLAIQPHLSVSLQRETPKEKQREIYLSLSALQNLDSRCHVSARLLKMVGESGGFKGMGIGTTITTS